MLLLTLRAVICYLRLIVQREAELIRAIESLMEKREIAHSINCRTKTPDSEYMQEYLIGKA